MSEQNIDFIAQFNTKISEVINQSQLPFNVVELCLQNVLYQIQIMKLSNIVESKNKISEEITEDKKEN